MSCPFIFLDNQRYFLTGNKKEMILVNDDFEEIVGYHFSTPTEYVGVPTALDFDDDGFSDFVSIKKC